MPSKSTRADRFLRYKNVSIYHVYKNDDMESGAREFWYSTSPYGTDQGGDPTTFDIRDLPGGNRCAGARVMPCAKRVIEAAIRRGLLRDRVEAAKEGW